MRAVIILTIVTAGGLVIFFLTHKAPEDYAVETVAAFYTFEQDGDFSDSWELFHPLMKKKFGKGEYIQDRAHVFMNHFGVTTFSYSLSEAVEIKNWKHEKGAKPMKLVYKIAVAQTFKGKYGRFSISQDVYVTETADGWMLLWDYKK